MEIELDGLVLDTATHRYTWDGAPVGGVSEIIQALGLVDPRWFTDYSRDRGTAVHAALEYLALGVLDWRTVDPRIEGFVRAGERFMIDAGVPIGGDILTERIVYNPVRRYAGKLDLFAPVFGQPTVVDWKSGGLGFAGLATAAYEEALRMDLGRRDPFRRMAVQLRDDGMYRKTDYFSSLDYVHWACCTELFNSYHLPRRRKNVE